MSYISSHVEILHFRVKVRAEHVKSTDSVDPVLAPPTNLLAYRGQQTLQRQEENEGGDQKSILGETKYSAGVHPKNGAQEMRQKPSKSDSFL